MAVGTAKHSSRSILVVAGSRKERDTHQGALQRLNQKMDFARSVLYRRLIENRAGRASFFALDNCGNVRWECRFKATVSYDHGEKTVVEYAQNRVLAVFWRLIEAKETKSKFLAAILISKATKMAAAQQATRARRLSFACYRGRSLNGRFTCVATTNLLSHLEFIGCTWCGLCAVSIVRWYGCQK